ncbi:MAG TPA: glycosyltransferase family 2 protein [Ferruginibacter sp.]|nr:glycosyltransferase family 2 protein [Ferruginibacter sp.]HRO16815.1 glycosyltransferase family 2 protein [Ferruginibacter sp.]HRQ20098.1 glycosyltransferase family 2 protein [Ferruginibacter sp.]
MELSVIIVNYNVRHFLEQCLHSVQRACEGIRAEIIVVDNQSTDGSENYLKSKFTHIDFRWNNQNVGFAAANNNALASARGKYILFLNPDTLLPEDCLHQCMDFMKQADAPGALGVRMIDGSGQFLPESKRGKPTAMASLFRLSGISYLFPQSPRYAAYYAGHLSDQENHVVDVIAGAFMMVEKKVLEEVGGFDTSFFMYGEDIDLSYRIQQAGYRNYYFAGTTILHFKGESTVKSSAYVRHFYHAMKLFVQKHYRNPVSRWAMLLAIRVGGFLSFLKNAIQRAQPHSSPKTIHAALVTSGDYLSTLVQCIKHAKVPVMIHGRVSARFDDEAFAIGFIDDIPQLVQKGITHLVFSTDVLTYREIIDKVQHYRKHCRFLFHYAGSCSIVGSDDKNSRGITIAER